jgi:hypothetical protein
MQQASPICVHCGAVVRRTDKPFCAHCGNYWGASEPEEPLMLGEEEGTDNDNWMNVLFPTLNGEERERLPVDGMIASVPQVVIQEVGIKRESVQRDRKETSEDMAEEHLLSTQPSSIDEILEKLRELQHRVPYRSQWREDGNELRALPINDLLQQIQQLQTKLQGEQGGNSLGNGGEWMGATGEQLNVRQESSPFAQELRNYLERARKYAELLDGLPIEESQEQALLQQLMHIVRDLDFTQPYHVMLLAYTFASARMLLAALLREPLFRLPLGENLANVSLRIRFCAHDEEERLKVLLLGRDKEGLSVPRAQWSQLWTQPRDIFPTLALEDIQRVEITLRAEMHAFLSEGSVLDVMMCANGGLAGRVIWDEEYPEIHALLVTADHARLHSAAMQRWIEQMQYRLEQQGVPIQVNQDIFLVAVDGEAVGEEHDQQSRDTHDMAHDMVPYEGQERGSFVRAASAISLESKQFLYYTVRALDAFYAEMGLQKVELPEPLQAEKDHYSQEVVALKDRPRGPEVPFVIPAPDVSFMDISLELHEYMLQFSGVPTIVARVRQSMQRLRAYERLGQVNNAFRKVYHLLEEICWKKLEESDLRLVDRRLETIETAMANREQRRNIEIRAFLARQVQLMDIAWNDARLVCMQANQEGNDTQFHQALEACHQRSADYVRHRIQQGFFDSYIGNDTRRRAPGGAGAIQQSGREIQLWNLLEKMRASLQVALEEELHHPARELAETFVRALQEQEQGPLDLAHLFFHEESESFSQLQMRYQAIKQEIHAKAYAAALCITLSELLSEKRRLTPESQSVRDLMALVSGDPQPQAAFQQQCRERLEAILQEMRQGMVEQTEQIILDFFSYELDTFQSFEVYDWERRKELSTEPGKFTQLLHDVEDQLVEYLRTSASYRKKLVQQLYPREDEVPYWYHLIEVINRI